MNVLMILNPVFYILLMVVPLYKAGKHLIPFFRGYTKRSTVKSPDSILDCLEGNTEVKGYKTGWSYPEFLFNGVSPILGSIFIFMFSREIKPFDLEHCPTLLAFSILPFVAYWLVRINKGTSFSIKSLAIVESSLVFGIILYFAYGLHFCSEMGMAGVFFLPIFGFALLAPIPAMFYLIRELIIVKSVMRTKTDNELTAHSMLKPKFRVSERVKGYLFFAGIIIILKITLIAVGGQEWDSLIQAFTGGRDFLFSIK